MQPTAKSAIAVASPDTDWDSIADRDRASWYLDPLVGRQKQELHLRLIRAWMPADARVALKTDLFEEAYGKDDLLSSLTLLPVSWMAMDVSAHMVQRAAHNVAGAFYFTGDARSLPLASRCLDVVVSTSTLDHFTSRAEFETAIGELARVLRPGARLMITVDNPSNPLYPVLKWLCNWGPFPLGYTPNAATLKQILSNAGLQVTATDVLIHNPRLLSTGIFLALRYCLGSYANGPVRWFLSVFARLDGLPTRRFTACFLAANALKRR